MKLKDLMEKYGEYEVNSKCVVGECEIERIVIDLTKPKPKTVWDLEKGDKCYYIDHFGDIEDTGGYLSPLSEVVDMGNVFLTQEEAEKEVERRKVETLLLKYGGRRWFKDDSETGEKLNWHIFYGFDVGVGWGGALQGTIYFDTKEQAQNAIDEIGEDRIKDALFEVR